MKLEKNNEVTTRGNYEQRLIQGLRERFYLIESECSDEELLRVTKGTLNRSGVEMNIAVNDFKIAMRESVPRRIKQLFTVSKK
jgi:hypothetical protein